MAAQIITVTVQAALFSAVSTTLAQSITAWQSQKLAFDYLPFLNFILIAIIVTPPNYLYQRWLEDTFPSKIPVSKQTKGKNKPNEPSERLSKKNTFAKFFLDQSIGAAANTAAFICLIGFLKGKSYAQIGYETQRDFWPMLTAGWRVWPTVTLLNLVVVPFEFRMLLGNIVGVLWGVYITLQAM